MRYLTVYKTKDGYYAIYQKSYHFISRVDVKDFIREKNLDENEEVIYAQNYEALGKTK